MKRILFAAIALLSTIGIMASPITADNDSIYSLQDTIPALELTPAKALKADSIALIKTDSATSKNTWAQHWIYNRSIIGVPLILSGVIAKRHDRKVRMLRNAYLPNKKTGIDNYVQYTPAIILYGLKTLGVESRSSWSRMMASDAFSVAIMASVVNSIKYRSRIMRPDGSSRNSFPSGHTATAFMAATMLNKEYGHLSPWVGFGSYTLAATAGALRITNNRHWLSDVMVGAGIGVVSTEVGYWIADLLFKDKGVTNRQKPEELFRDDRPSFLGLTIGYNISISNYDTDASSAFPMKNGSTAGVEGAYFFNPYVGIGGRYTVSGNYVDVPNNNGEGSVFKVSALCAGAYFSYPLTTRWLLGSKILGGGLHYPRLNLTTESIRPRNGFGFSTGLSVAYRCRQHYALKLFLDYNIYTPHSRKSREMWHSLTNGLSYQVTL